MSDDYLFEHPGRCPICESDVTFVARYSWFRDHLLCPLCQSIPRERALMCCIEQFFPDWRTLRIHESSPVDRGASVKLREASGYIASQYVPSMSPGEQSSQGWIHQDLENQTFADESLDLVVTQDVFEHVFDIDKALQEIARTIRPGGAHIFTTPLVNKTKETEVRALRESDGSIIHVAPPEYHGNPVNSKGSLVTWHFGFDLAERIIERTGMPTIIIFIDDLNRGIRAEYIEVMASFKRTSRCGS